MQVWSSQHTSPAEVAQAAIAQAAASAWRDLAAIAPADTRVTRVTRLTIVRGPSASLEATLVPFVSANPVLWLVVPDVHAYRDLLRVLTPEMRQQLHGRLFTADQVARGQHRAAGYAGWVVLEWDALTPAQQVALEADLRPIVAIGLRG